MILKIVDNYSILVDSLTIGSNPDFRLDLNGKSSLGASNSGV